MKKIILILFFTSLIFSQVNPIVTIAEKLNSGYDLVFSENQITLFNSCDTLQINRSIFTRSQIKKIEKLWRAEIKRERSYRKYAVNLLRMKIKNQEPEQIYIRFYSILNKNKALLAAQNNILGIDSIHVLNARHSLDSIEIVMRLVVQEKDTTIIKQQYSLGNLIMPTWRYFTVDSLRNFLNNSLRWTNANP